MTKEVDQVLEWISTEGPRKCLLIVEDTELPEDDIKRKTIEVSEYDQEEDQWKTVEKLDYADEILSYGIPESLVD